jgi:arylsulfatase A-like enzyme
MKTPNLDKLAATGLQFDFAYTQFAYCAPSRNSFMSGRRPDRTRALNFMTTFRQCRESVAPGCGPGAAWVALPEFFRIHGYWTSSAGKVYHDGMDDHDSWSYRSNQTAWYGKHLLWRHFILKMMLMPRQARDKYRKTPFCIDKRAFSTGLAARKGM